MNTLGHAAFGALILAMNPTFADELDRNPTVSLTAMIDELRTAERSNRETTRTIEALGDTEPAGNPLLTGRLSENAWAARKSAESDLARARVQLELARLAVRQQLDGIRIEGAESVEIGGEVRTARLVEAAWRRVVERASANIALVQQEVARMKLPPCDWCIDTKVASQE